MFRRLRRHIAHALLRPDLSTPEDRLRTLSRLARGILPGYPLHWPDLDWIADPGFRAVLERFGEEKGYDVHRRFALHELHRLADGVEGDTAECGVFKGCGSWIVCQANRGTGRVHHGFDSFQGLSAPSEKHDGEYWAKGNLAVGKAEAERALAEFGVAVRLYEGWIPSRFPEVADRKFSFVHVDVDLHDPTRDSLEFFWPRLSPGGVLVCDDYGFTTCPGATRAVNEFLGREGRPRMVSLPTGGGFVVKARGR